MSGFHNGFINVSAVERARAAGRQRIQQENSTRARDMAERSANGLAHPTAARAKTLETVQGHKPLTDWAEKGWKGVGV
jgi:hypothetical protein